MKALEAQDKLALEVRPPSAALVPAIPASIETVHDADLVAEKSSLVSEEAKVQKKYSGLRGYLRILEVTRVIAKLSLYLYLDQYEVHRAQMLKHARVRMGKATRLTRLAVYGEKLYQVRKWFFNIFVLFVRRLYLGAETNRERNQEKQAVWLKNKLIDLGPTFIKIGQSMGTRADLLPLPFVTELGTLVDQVPPFANEEIGRAS